MIKSECEDHHPEMIYMPFQDDHFLSLPTNPIDSTLCMWFHVYDIKIYILETQQSKYIDIRDEI